MESIPHPQAPFARMKNTIMLKPRAQESRISQPARRPGQAEETGRRCLPQGWRERGWWDDSEAEYRHTLPPPDKQVRQGEDLPLVKTKGNTFFFRGKKMCTVSQDFAKCCCKFLSGLLTRGQPYCLIEDRRRDQVLGIVGLSLLTLKSFRSPGCLLESSLGKSTAQSGTQAQLRRDVRSHGTSQETGRNKTAGPGGRGETWTISNKRGNAALHYQTSVQDAKVSLLE